MIVVFLLSFYKTLHIAFLITGYKGIETLSQTQNFEFLYLWNLLMLTFDILNLDYLIWQNSQFEISKVYNIGLQKYRVFKIRVCGKDSITLWFYKKVLQKKKKVSVHFYSSKNSKIGLLHWYCRYHKIKKAIFVTLTSKFS